MAKKIVLMGLFTDVMKTAEALDGLRLLGLREEDMSIMQGVPHTSKMLGRPKIHERIPWATILGALTGLMVAIFLTYGTQWLYPIRVGGREFSNLPPAIIPMYELTMLGLILGTFLNMVWKCGFPSTKPQYYDPHHQPQPHRRHVHPRHALRGRCAPCSAGQGRRARVRA